MSYVLCLLTHKEDTVAGPVVSLIMFYFDILHPILVHQYFRARVSRGTSF